MYFPLLSAPKKTYEKQNTNPYCCLEGTLVDWTGKFVLGEYVRFWVFLLYSQHLLRHDADEIGQCTARQLLSRGYFKCHREEVQTSVVCAVNEK